MPYAVGQVEEGARPSEGMARVVLQGQSVTRGGRHVDPLSQPGCDAPPSPPSHHRIHPALRLRLPLFSTRASHTTVDHSPPSRANTLASRSQLPVSIVHSPDLSLFSIVTLLLSTALPTLPQLCLSSFPPSVLPRFLANCNFTSKWTQSTTQRLPRYRPSGGRCCHALSSVYTSRFDRRGSSAGLC